MSLLLLFAGKGVNEADVPTAKWYRIGSMWYRISGGAPPAYTPSYDFSDARNSQYLGGLFGGGV